MKKRLLALVAMVVLGVGLMPGVASAQTTTQTDAQANLHGTGRVYAQGKGTAELQGAGWVNVWLDGDVNIVDNAGDMRVRVVGGTSADATERALAELALTDYRGRIHVRGSDFSVRVDGEIVLRAGGKGTVTLTGEGVYGVNRGRLHRWDGTSLRFGA